ncbi:LCP family protein [uncultured Cellulomonas sp.]|uniref:LCP family glycopolymer transferase n=1 Tax=uncultured Cellulomonas sp. TaxID=189682 RepID=UPI0028EB7D46|nr:LCP family protein [uncultured Cellulomonas sp.]
MTPTPAATSVAVARRFRVLVVGTTNVCRSLAAERLLLDRLGDSADVAVTSAGTHPEPGERVPEHLTELLDATGVAAGGHRPREIDRDLVESADLVLTVTRHERSAVVRLVPSAVGRTFTVRELARVAASLGPSALPEGDAAGRLDALVRAAPARRGPTAPAVAADDDLADPADLGRGAYQRSLDQVRAAVEDIARPVLAHPGDDNPPPPTHDEPPVRRSHRARNALIAVLGSLVLLLVVATAGALLVAGMLDNRVERFADPFAGLTDRPAPVASGGERPMTILVLGSTDDVRTEDGQGWAAAAAQTDVVLLAHVAADRASAQVVAMPPDLSIQSPDSPDTAGATLRSAFAVGGPAGAVQAVEQLTDVRLDHVALTDSETFARVTESLGGVDLQLDSPLVVGGRQVGAGERRLDGTQALAWVREPGDDDLARAERSVDWLRAILDRLGDGDVRNSPATWLRLLGVVSGSVAVDEGFDRAEMVGLLTSIRTLGPGEVEVVPVPTTVSAVGGAPVVVPDAAPFAALMDALRTDTLGRGPAPD